MPTDDLKIRIPQDMKDWLRQRADENSRTMNGEVVSLIKAAMGEHQGEQAFWNTLLPNGQTLRQADGPTADLYIRKVHKGEAVVVTNELGAHKVVELSDGAA